MDVIKIAEKMEGQVKNMVNVEGLGALHIK